MANEIASVRFGGTRLGLWFAGAVLLGCGAEVKVGPPPATGDAPSSEAPVAEETGARPETRERAAAAAATFEKQCAVCHGDDGRGDGPAAYLLYPRPRDFGTGLFRLVSTVNGFPSDRDLFRTITRGIPRSSMPAWSHLTEEDRWGLVHHVRKLTREGVARALLEDAQASGDDMSMEEAQEIAMDRTTPGATTELPPETPLTLEALARGRQLFIARCALCHGADGKGTGRDDLVDEKGVPIRARDYTRGIFKGGKASEDLAHRILSGIPGTPMPANARDFHMEDPSDEPDAEDLWALVHYVQSFIRPDAQELAEQGQRELVVQRRPAVPKGVADPAWNDVPPTYLSLMHLWWSDTRAEGVLVRTVHDGRRLAIHLTWEDGTKNSDVLTQESFSDAAAIQLSPILDPPLFTMGSPESPVTIWHWKAHWQADLERFADVETTHPNVAVDTYDSLPGRPLGLHAPVAQFEAARHDPVFLTGWGAGNLMSTPDRQNSVESLVAEGFGTLTSRPAAEQETTGDGQWADGFWQASFTRDLRGTGDGAVHLEPGTTASIALAVWEGSVGDRNGQKSVTIWHRITIE